jgi:simple sugar transport system permease protein
MEFFNTLVLVVASTIRLSVPLLLACLAGLYSERSGVFDIGLEGKMLVAAFAAGAAAAVASDDPGLAPFAAWIGLLAAVAASVAFALVHGFASITHRGNQIVSGVAINFLASGLTAVLGNAWFGQGGRTPQLDNSARFDPIIFPPADQFEHVPILGIIYGRLISGHNLLVYIAFAAVPATISVVWLRYRAVICAGLLCGIAGSYLSIALSAGFIRDMTAGRGFIALAALIFAKWRPVQAMFTCLLFGFLDAVAIRLQGTPIPGVGQVPVQIFQALPYVLTVILLAGFIGQAIPPKAGGVPYVKER